MSKCGLKARLKLEPWNSEQGFRVIDMPDLNALAGDEHGAMGWLVSQFQVPMSKRCGQFFQFQRKPEQQTPSII